MKEIQDFIELVRRNRQGVLLASAGALLHNLGKVNSKFIEGHISKGSKRGDYLYQHICGLFLDDVKHLTALPCNPVLKKLYDILNDDPANKNNLAHKTVSCLKKDLTTSLPEPFCDRTYRIGDLIEYLGQGEKSPFYKKPDNVFVFTQLFPSTLLTHLMNCCHDGASGGEKQGILKLQQALLYIATPCGMEALLELAYDKLKNRAEEIIQEYLADLQDPFPLIDFMNKIKPVFQKALGDTRRPFNDITVWDLGHTGMAFLKSGIWSVNLSKSHFSHDDLCDYRTNPRWRLWRCGLDGLDYLTGAVSVADLRVRQRKLAEYLDYTQRLFESDFPVGTEIYRDENGSIYVFPDFQPGGREDKAFSALYHDELPTFASLQPAIDDFPSQKKLTMGELYGIVPGAELSIDNFHNHPKCRDPQKVQQGQNKIRYIGDQVEEWIVKNAVASSVPEVWRKYPGAGNGDSIPDLCPYCNIRPIGSGAELVEDDHYEQKKYANIAKQRKVCCPCMSERGKIGEDWWMGKKRFSTIWVDEVADNNGCIALVTGMFCIDKTLARLFYPKKIKDMKVKEGTPLDSFARFRRVWETTAKFWMDVLPPEYTHQDAVSWKDAFRCSLFIGEGVLGSRQRLGLRLQIDGDHKEIRLVAFQPYELVGAGFRCGLVCIKAGEKAEFITIENLGFIARQLGAKDETVTDPVSAAYFVSDKLQNLKNLQLQETTGYGSSNKVRGNVIVHEIYPDLEPYWPAIPIMAEPRVFAALVPGTNALDVVKKIKRKYEQEMGKVRWRLPLKLGLVFFSHHTPLRVVLDAGWRILNSECPELSAEVQDTRQWGSSSLIPPKINYPATVDIRAKLVSVAEEHEHGKNGRKTHGIQKAGEHEHQMNWHVSTVMGDRQTFDIWYPWIRVIDPGPNLPFEERDFSIEHDRCRYLHIKDLQKGDKVRFTLSTFDFIELDHPGRRFQLLYNSLKRPESNRPYLLEELDQLENIWEIIAGKKGLTSSQIHSIWSLLLAKQQEWSSSRSFQTTETTWQIFCRDVLLNAGWPGGLPAQEELDELVESAVTGTLFDVLELYLTILKIKPHRD